MRWSSIQLHIQIIDLAFAIQSGRCDCMSALSPIAKLVEAMLASNAEPHAIVLAVERAELDLRTELKSRPTRRGTRLSEDWKPNDADIAYAAALRMPEPLIALEAEKFRNYWTAKAGAGATKRDWSATWRNWILNAMERRHDARQVGPGSPLAARRSPTGADAVLAGMGRLAHRLAERRAATESRDRQVGADDNAPRQLGFDADAKD